MQNYRKFITNREIILDNDMNTLSDDYMEVDEEQEIEIDHFNLSKEWIKKIKTNWQLIILCT